MDKITENLENNILRIDPIIIRIIDIKMII